MFARNRLKAPKGGTTYTNYIRGAPSPPTLDAQYQEKFPQAEKYSPHNNRKRSRASAGILLLSDQIASSSERCAAKTSPRRAQTNGSAALIKAKVFSVAAFMCPMISVN